MIFEEKICYMFNKFFSSFIKDLKEMHDSLKVPVKANYKIIDKSSEEYYTWFWKNVSPYLKNFIDGDITEEVYNTEIVKGITLRHALDNISDVNHEAFWNYVNCLIIFGYLYTEYKNHSVSSDVVDEEPNQEGEQQTSVNSDVYLLFVRVVKILSMIQKGEDPIEETKDIIDDDVKKLLEKIKVFKSDNDEIHIDETADTLPAGAKEFFENIENSKIASLAKDIAKDIDISNLNIEKPEDIAKLMDFSGSNNFLGNIVSKVSSSLTEKMTTGELKQEDLMSEALSMMNLLNSNGKGGGITDLLKGMGGLGDLMNNPMMSEMMKMAKKGKVGTKNSGGTKKSKGSGQGLSTRDRLRKKLEEKRKQNVDASKDDEASN